MNTKLSIQLNHTHANFDRFNPSIEYTQLLKPKVESLGLSISEIAKRIGYQNLGKGSRRIRKWINDDCVLNSKEGNAFLSLVELGHDDLTEHKINYKLACHKAAIYHETNFEKEILKQHHALLLDNLRTITSNYQYDTVILPDIGLFAYMVIVPPFVLGQLIEAWSIGIFKRDDLYFFKSIGSLMSGTHKVYGFSSIDGSEHCIPQGLGRYNDTRKQCRPYQTSHSKWSLGQVVADLGATIPPTLIYRQGVIIGSYDYKTRVLKLRNQEWDLSHEFTQPNQPTVLSEEGFTSFNLHKQNIQYQNDVLVHWTQDLPPIVAQHICNHVDIVLTDG